ncbi:uncharacterized protein B0H18DRAFT_1115442 [Fomitopsis serialis]|uniref:uncharacterized protein n=1 Tax=Fomitopsis serialis TaxID=139415 RepID=UPI0020088F86|nr:uncharacterized protein B0H18DRAFT_1115442 [Neoantrodia serialis]KAH9933441.1 hypothetical protein B0H18DRAFT_1115442 [Neoantrodia serialis]
MAIQSSPLCLLPLEIRVEIALQVALLRTPHGPPKDIVPLLLSCKTIHDSLVFEHCAPLYARIYRSNFDVRAPRRRFASDELHVQNYAAQLKKCCIVLKRIRSGDLDSEFLQDDLWTAVLMALENDGKNGEQLDWACLDDLLRRFILERLWDGREQSGDWPSESAVNALAVWLFWYRLNSDKLDALPSEQRASILELVRPYALIGTRYPPFHAPDCHFALPMRPDRAMLTDRQKIPTPHGFWPLYRTPEESIHHIDHYGGLLEITEPLLALGAQLLFFTLYWQPLIIPPSMPADRAHALALGRTGVGETRADLEEYNASSPVKLLEKADWDWYHNMSDKEREREDAPRWTRGMRSPSAQWECDFNRMVGCVDPYSLRPMAVTYEYGTLTGLWKGLHLSPHPEQYFAAVQSVNFPPDFSAENPHLFMHPVYLQLREHHCVSPARPAPCGGNPNDNDDGINHAWLPSAFDVREANGIVRLRNLQRINEPAAVYETFVEGQRNSHNPETCRTCVARQKAADALLAEKVERHRRKASAGASPPRERNPPPIRTNIKMHTCYGRIRPWDGLVALVRVPLQPPGRFGVYIFRGYIVGGKNFVGSWRVRTDNTRAVPLEGPFIMSRVE